MRSEKPSLLDVTAGGALGGDGRRSGHSVPGNVTKIGAMLVDGERVKSGLHQARQFRAVKLGGVIPDPWNGKCIEPHRADRVEDTYTFDRYAARPLEEEFLGQIRRLAKCSRIVRHPPIGLKLMKFAECFFRFAQHPLPPVRCWLSARRLARMSAENLIGAPEFLQRHRRTAPQKTALRDQPYERPRRECAAAEAKNINLIALLVLLDQPVIGFAHVFR